MNLILSRPLAILDLETTGLNPAECRIVEVSILLLPNDEQRTRRLNPGVQVGESVQVHGITNDDVKDCPTFATVAKGLLEFLSGCDLCGFNLKRFDLRVLAAEFARCDLAFDLAGRSIIDVCEIFHQREPRNLAGAVKFYTIDAFKPHAAEGDVLATMKVLDRMLDFYPDLPRSTAELAAAFTDPNAVDLDGFFTRRDGTIVFAKGKHQGKPIVGEKNYLRWMLGADFAADTKLIAQEAME